jgi:hypothetical protein
LAEKLSSPIIASARPLQPEKEKPRSEERGFEDFKSMEAVDQPLVIGM